MLIRQRPGGLAVVGCFLLFALLSTGAVLGQRLDAQAIPGQPFGIGAVSFSLSPEGSDEGELFVEDRSGRVLYPVFAAGRLSRLLGNFVDINPVSDSRTLLFLFRGDEPLQLTIHAGTPMTVELPLRSAPARARDRLLMRWWREYYAASRTGASPAIMHNYLTQMLEQRLGVRTPLLARVTQQSKSQLESTLDLLFGTDVLQLEMMREVMAGGRLGQPADQPLPLDLQWPSLEIPVPPDVAVEPIAKHVPEECYYVRFGTFENYLWLEAFLTKRAGGANGAPAAGTPDVELSNRIRRQLAMPFTLLTKVVGPKLIDDMALIGRDIYLRDGAAAGILLQAHNSAALEASLNQQRLAAMAAEKQWGATMQTVEIVGRKVSFLSTPDNQLRSFYAIDGDFHLVTSSRSIVERFFEAGRGDRSLANSPEFLHARAVMPISRGDTIFAFLSTDFVQGLFSPHHQIELRRRLQAVANMQLRQLAELVAKAEGAPHQSVNQLIAGGFLPQGFESVTDPGTASELDVDPVRGARGWFAPICDIKLAGATRSEVDAYTAFAEQAVAQWRQLDPVMIAIKRSIEPLARRERLTVEANLSPLAEEKFGWLLSVVGPPVTQQVVPNPDDIVSIQAFVTGGDVAPQFPPHLMYVGLQNVRPQSDFRLDGPLQTLAVLQSAPGYIAAWPKPGFLDWLPFGAQPPAHDGFTQLPLGGWRWQSDDFSAISFQREILEKVTPHLRIEDATTPAQIRIRVGDLSQSQLRDWVNSMYYQQARGASVGNVRQVHNVAQQLRLTPQEAMKVTERLNGLPIACPLGGKIQLAESPTGRNFWRSTAWDGQPSGSPPADYAAPLLNWFRGMEVSVTKAGGRVSMHAELDIVESETASVGPLFDLFRKAE